MIKPLLSVITICYENPIDLDATIVSIKKYYIKFIVEFIVIDGSKSNLCSSVIENNKWVDIYIHEPDFGRFNAMNKGIAMANGDYLIFMNSGDIFYQHIDMNEIYEKLRSGLGNTIYYGDYIKSFGKHQYICLVPEEINRNSFIDGESPCHQTLFIPSKFCKKEYYTENLSVSADTLFIIKAFEEMKHKHLGQIIAVFSLGGASNNPKSISSVIKYWNERRQARNLRIRNYLPNLFKSVIKFFLIKVIGFSIYYRIVFFFKYKSNKNIPIIK